MGLVHARPAGAAVALESQQWLGTRTRYPRLERMPDHLYFSCFGAALSDPSQRISPGFCGRPEFPQWQALLRHHAAVGRTVRRPALFVAIFFLRNRSARLEGQLRGLLATKCQPCTDQSRALYGESLASQRLWRVLLGSDIERRRRRLRHTCPGQRRRHHIAHRGAVQHALCTEGGDASAAALPQRLRREDLGPLWLR